MFAKTEGVYVKLEDVHTFNFITSLTRTRSSSLKGRRKLRIASLTVYIEIGV